MDKSSLVKSIIFMISGFVVFLLYLYFVAGIENMMSVFREIDFYNYSLYYTLAIVAMILSVLLYSMSWNALMSSISVKVGLKKTFLYCWLGNFVDLVIPFETVSGEITKAYLVYRETNDQPGKVIASVIAHRILTTSIVLSSLVVSSLLLINKYNIDVKILYLLLATIFGSLALIIGLILLSLKVGAAEKIVDLLLNFIAPMFRERLNVLSIKEKAHLNLLQFHDGFKLFSRRKRILLSAATCSFFAWLLHLSVYFLVFYALGFDKVFVKVYEMAVVYSISVAVQSTPIALPTGLVEIAMTSLYILFGFPTAISGAATLFIRVITFWLQIIVGYVISQWIGVKNLLAQRYKSTST